MIHDKDRLFDKNGRSFAITHNLKGNSIEEWEEQFKLNESYRLRKRTDSVYLTHEIISLHRDDAKHITLEKLQTIANEYIFQRNPHGMYVAVPHFDKEHYHIHICASGIEYKTGKSLRLNKPNLLALKKNIQQFQIERFPELSNSVVKHGGKEKSLLTDKEYQIKLRTGRETGKGLVIGMLKTCYKKAISIETFYQLVKESGLKTYERGGKITGVEDGKYKYRFSRLGFTEERINDLEVHFNRSKDLHYLRSTRGQKRTIER